jgi:hypothetical protein
MARALSVKVPTTSVIALIEGKIADIEANIASYPADVKAYKEAYKAYKAELLTLAVNAIKANPDVEGFDVMTSYNGRDVSVTIDGSLLTLPEPPVKPTEPNQREWIGREHISRLEVLKKNLAVLKLTTQEEINASSYSSVMELL